MELARRLDGEIVIADSRQVYRGVDVATAKPSAAERSRIAHHLVDVVDLGERYTAADYAADADAALDAIHARGRVPIVCGGTGLYLAALAGALDPIEEAAGPEGRAAARARVEAIPDGERHAALADVDPRTAARLPPRDRQRIDRALEVWFLTGRPLSSHHEGGRERRPHVAVRLARTRPELLRRIDERLDAMLAAGLEREARGLWEAGRSPSEPGLDTIGIQEWWPHFEGERGREETIDEIRAATRRYAKRQTTWFRHRGEYRSIPADGAVPSILDLWSRAR
jgi:tRNA dimethylallyltransferase